MNNAGLWFEEMMKMIKTYLLVSVKFLLLSLTLGLVLFHQSAYAEDKSRIKYDYVTDNPDAKEKVVGSKNDTTTVDSTKLYAQVKALVKEFFPKAKVKEKKNELHVEYKIRPYVIASTNKIEKGPKWGGVLFDMKLINGKYTGVHSVPKKFNEYSYFHVLLMAPYSEDKNCHLLTRISYPFDIPPDFLKRLTAITNKFETYM